MPLIGFRVIDLSHILSDLYSFMLLAE